MHRHVLALLASLAPLAGSLAPPLARALKAPRPIVVELLVDAPLDPDTARLDVESLSAQLRTCGANALIIRSDLIGEVANEQESARGSFPEPLPLLSHAGTLGNDADWKAALAAVTDANAAGLALRCADVGGADELREALEATCAAGLESLVLAGSPELLGIATAAGATAVACVYAEASKESAEEAGAKSDGAAPAMLGAWDGEDDELARLRDAGFSAMLLLDGCGGDVAAGAGYCESRVRAFRSKASNQWGGSMFASTNSDVAPPSARNPRMWAQSQRQAREIMHESAASRGLPPPKIKRNTVL